jgi:hypothetical protein
MKTTPQHLLGDRVNATCNRCSGSRGRARVRANVQRFVRSSVQVAGNSFGTADRFRTLALAVVKKTGGYS